MIPGGATFCSRVTWPSCRFLTHVGHYKQRVQRISRFISGYTRQRVKLFRHGDGQTPSDSRRQAGDIS